MSVDVGGNEGLSAKERVDWEAIQATRAIQVGERHFDLVVYEVMCPRWTSLVSHHRRRNRDLSQEDQSALRIHDTTLSALLGCRTIGTMVERKQSKNIVLVGFVEDRRALDKAGFVYGLECIVGGVGRTDRVNEKC